MDRVVVTPTPFTFDILTMGCKVNTYDTSLLEKNLRDGGFLPSKVSPHVHIINSCAVTEKSSLETHKLVKKIKAHHPNSKVVITGCVAQVDVERLKSLNGADLIIGNSHKGDFNNIIRSCLEGKTTKRVFHSNIFKKEALDEGGGIESSRTRAFLKIQDGCNSFCSFCIIPFARGKSRSLPLDHLVSRVCDLHQRGFKEVVLTGVHCGDYEDMGRDFSDLVEAVLEQTKISRVRLSSLEPIEVTEKLWRLFKNNQRLCPHIHVSLQSANSKVLRDMRRNYGQDEIQKFFTNFKKNIPNGFIGMDVIVGFPGETQEEFDDTFNFLKSMPWTRIHVFPYSIRPGTKAEKLQGHLGSKVIGERAKKLRALSLERQLKCAKDQRGQRKKVLVLEKPAHDSHGLSHDYWPVKIEKLDETSFECLKNQEIDVEITDFFETKSGEQALVGRSLAL